MITLIAQAFVLLLSALQAPSRIPSGFTPIFNGVDLTGWHISQVNHHGNSRGWTVENGILLATQDKPGNGGILLTDRKYRNFEVSLEVNPDWGCDGGLFLRSTERGKRTRSQSIICREGLSAAYTAKSSLISATRVRAIHRAGAGKKPGAKANGTSSGHASRVMSRISRYGLTGRV